ncbi:LysR family transcriptional regulator [Magnetospirillum fulvum]|uniref:LysR family transcriptional regulator n=1 Tax=Magnetospirillum fulvum MGU-K5 TaxID=1316936 RepID=S9SE85_MAGFU|nr:LysR family transcriptional regulator [Magnetospirillum fulvum]EPY03044.1 LysR family transcriptional regulator [Magnetospirillum fulvum MGU-K5]
MDTVAVAILVAAAQAGSLSAAARRLHLTPMSATRRLAALERDLGVRLLHRTTRSVALTPEGEAFLPFAQTLIESEAAGRARLHEATLQVSGLLRVTAPVAFGRKIIAPLVPGLLRDHPDLQIELHLNDAVVDLVAAGFDLAIRIAPLRDSELIARRLADSTRVLCAAPSYVAARGLPERLDDLAAHECLASTGTTHWTFRVNGKEHKVRIAGRFTSNGIDGLHQACLGGAGIALLALWNVRDDLRSGRLVRVPLGDVCPEERSIWAVYPSARYVLPKLRAFLSVLEAELARD